MQSKYVKRKYLLLTRIWSSPGAFADLPRSVSDAAEFFRHDEIFVAEAFLILGEWTVTIVLRVVGPGRFVGASLPVFLLLLFGCYLSKVFIVFGIVRSIIFTGANIAVF